MVKGFLYSLMIQSMMDNFLTMFLGVMGIFLSLRRLISKTGDIYEGDVKEFKADGKGLLIT